MKTPRNLIVFSLLISMLLNVIVGSCEGENHTLTLFAFSESLFAKNQSLTSFNFLLTIWKNVLYFCENKKGLYRRQTLFGLNILSLYEEHSQKLGTTKVLKLSPEELHV